MSGIAISDLPTAPDEIAAALDAMVPPTMAEDRAYFIHTSGSTGQPKCVVHNQGSVDWHTHMTLIGSGLCQRNDVVLQVCRVVPVMRGAAGICF